MPLFGKRKLTQKKLEKIARLPCLQCRQTEYLNYGIDIDPSRLATPHACKIAQAPNVLATFSAPAPTCGTSSVWPSVREGDDTSYLLVPNVKQEIEDDEILKRDSFPASDEEPCWDSFQPPLEIGANETLLNPNSPRDVQPRYTSTPVSADNQNLVVNLEQEMEQVSTTNKDPDFFAPIYDIFEDVPRFQVPQLAKDSLQGVQTSLGNVTLLSTSPRPTSPIVKNIPEIEALFEVGPLPTRPTPAPRKRRQVVATKSKDAPEVGHQEDIEQDDHNPAPKRQSQDDQVKPPETITPPQAESPNSEKPEAESSNFPTLSPNLHLPIFGGSQEESITRFLARFEVVANIYKWNESEKIRYCLLCFKEKAETWIYCRSATLNSFTRYDDFKAYVCAAFPENVFRITLQSDLRSRNKNRRNLSRNLCINT